MPGFQVAIDGPAGSGKSTISQKVARKLNWTHIDTGAMYRAVTLKALETGIELSNPDAYRFLETLNICYDKNRIYLENRDVSEDIRSDAVTDNVSLVSSFPYVRDILVKLQRQAAMIGNVVMDGRDIGTVVLPEADLKIFLTANVEERAKRRYAEHLRKGKANPMKKVIDDIRTRDQKDSTRASSPLRMADDAIELDTTYLTVDDVVDKILELIDKKEKEHGD
ncbi:MAG: (d)CMP kinase [Acholeplasmataceae bacterium]|nr:(d)CMP kinase [Acholeplasmataceae bacterium]